MPTHLSLAQRTMFLHVSRLLLAAALMIGGWSIAAPFGGSVNIPLWHPNVGRPTLGDYGSLPLSFEANQGQSDSHVSYLARGAGYTLFLTPAEVVLALLPGVDDRLPSRSSRLAQSVALHMRLIGANPSPLVTGHDELPGKVNIFAGPDRAAWRTSIPTYAQVRYQEVYPGVDMLFYGNQRQLEYDFVVAPGADPRAIMLDMQGADRLEVDAQGDLVVQLPGGSLRQHRPIVYQDIAGRRQLISGSYVTVGAHQFGFQVGAYDRSRPLVIDPVLVYSTYLGGSGFDRGNDIAVDASGNAYVTGQTATANFPTTAGAYQTTYSGGDAFITKIGANGGSLAYSTYLAGAVGYGIAVDAAGSAYITGETGSLLFPTTAGAFQTPQWGYETFVTKLNASGSALVYSARFGGGFDDFGRDIAVDSAGNAYITGWTVCRATSCTFPTVNAFQPTYGGGNNDAFVTKLNASGSALIYSTYLGGGAILNTTDDWGTGIAVDSSGSAYVAGQTYSQDFPTTAGAYQRLGGGSLDAFVTKFTPSGTGLVYSTFLGGNGHEETGQIALDSAGNAYVTGSTTDSFPTTPGAFRTTGSFDAFVTKLNPQGSGLVYSTYLGGSGDQDRGWDIAVDSAGNAYIAGDTKSVDFPTASAIQPAYGGGLGDAFVTKLNASGSALVYSTFLGGSLSDDARGVALDGSGNAYVIGATSSYNFPTANPFQLSNAGGVEHHDDAFVVKISETATSTPRADLSLAMVDSPDPAGMNSRVSYTITESNAGPNPSSRSGLTIRIDPSFSIVSVTPNQGSCGVPDVANTLTCNLGAIASGGAATVVVAVTTPASTGSFMSDAFVSGGEFDPNTSNNAASAVTTVTTNPTPAPALASLTLNPASVTGGSSSQGTVTLSSAAPSDGALITLASNNTAAATVPASVTVPAGATSATFTVSSKAVAASTSVTISANYGGVAKTAVLTISPAAATDQVAIRRAEYTQSKQQLRVNATSTSASAILTVYVSSTGALIGTLANNGGGKYSGQFTWPSNPQTISVKSNLGGSATKTVTLK